MAPTEELPEWEILLRAAAHLQKILQDATLVGGTAATIEAGHRRSADAIMVLATVLFVERVWSTNGGVRRLALIWPDSRVTQRARDGHPRTIRLPRTL